MRKTPIIIAAVVTVLITPLIMFFSQSDIVGKAAGLTTCEVNRWNTTYYGIDNKLGYFISEVSGSNLHSNSQFLCYDEKFYTCGWWVALDHPDFATPVADGAEKGFFRCSLINFSREKVWNPDDSSNNMWVRR